LSYHDEKQLMKVVKKGTKTIAYKLVWFSTIPERISRLIDSMPQRVDAVLKSKGNPARYWFFFNKIQLI